jgi:multidrug efflux system membrane fusion protein
MMRNPHGPLPLSSFHPTRHAAAVLAACLLFGVAISGCAPATKARTPRVSVTVANAEKRAMPFAILSTGTVEPMQTASVGSQVGGVVTRVGFHEGDEVDQGALLFQLDPRPFRADLERAEAALARDRAQADVARSEAERSERLFQQQMISQGEWDQARAASEAAIALVRGDSAAAMTARLDLEYSSIRAPIPGRTGRLLVHVGDYVKAASTDPLVTINQVRPVRVAFTVPDNAVPMVQKYRDAHPRVLVKPPGNGTEWLDGDLVFVDNGVDAASGTLMLKGEFPNRDRRLVPGQFVDVRLVLYEDAHATVVPAVAVTSGQQGTYVYVMNADSTVTPRNVVVTRTMDDYSIVSDGLTPGETVVTDGQLRLSPGARVLVRPKVGEAP